MDDAITLIDGCLRGVFSKGHAYCALRRLGWPEERVLRAIKEDRPGHVLVDEYVLELEHVLMFKNIGKK